MQGLCEHLQAQKLLRGNLPLKGPQNQAYHTCLSLC